MTHVGVRRIIWLARLVGGSRARIVALQNVVEVACSVELGLFQLLAAVLGLTIITFVSEIFLLPGRV